MPNVAANPNFESIIAFGNIENVSGFALSTSQSSGMYLQPQKGLTSDAGLAAGAILVSQYQLLKDAGVAVDTILASQYQLLKDAGIAVDTIEASSYALVKNQIVKILASDFSLLALSNVRVEGNLSLLTETPIDIIDAFLLMASNDVRILVSDAPAIAPDDTGDDIAKITQQELLLGIFRPCKPCHRYDVNNRTKNRHSA